MFNSCLIHICLSFESMIKFLAFFIIYLWIPQLGKSQSTIDSLSIHQLKSIALISEIYSTPHQRYILDHFVFAWSTAGIDPQVQYNKGETISKESTLLFEKVKPGDTLIIKEVYAINSESPGKGFVKLPEKIFILK